MNAKTSNPLHIALACLALGLAAPGASAAHRCDSPQGHAEAEACAKAKEGADALRHYIQRTRAIYGLHYWDFAPKAELPAKTSERPSTAQAATTAQREVARSEAVTSK